MYEQQWIFRDWDKAKDTGPGQMLKFRMVFVKE